MSEKGSRDKTEAVVPETEAAPAIARLCYVDDSRTSAYVVRRLLQPLGYQVDHYSSAEPAFVALVQKNYDMLLTDLKVSANGMDGDELIHTLRNSGLPKISKLPIIVITGATDAQSLVDVYDAGANQVMKKPVDADELNRHIRRLLFDDQRPDKPSADATVVSLPTSHRPPPAQSADTAPLAENPITPAPVKPTVVQSVPLKTESEMPDESLIERAMRHETGDHSNSLDPEEGAIEEPVVDVAPGPLEDLATENHEEKIDIPAEPTFEREVNVSPDIHADDHVNEQIIIEPDMRNDRGKAHTNNSLDDNILHDMDQYALVVTERSSFLARSGILRLAHSLVELVGLRSLVLRALILGMVLTALVAGWNIYFNQGVAVETVFVESGEIFQSITVPGRLVSKQRVNVSPARAGRLVEINVQEGDRVKKGQVLAKMDDRELLSRLKRARANLTSAREAIVLAERTLNRLRKAYAKGAVARRFVEDAEVDLSAAKANAGVIAEEVNSANLDFSDQKITAAFAGTVTTRYAEIGQWVGPSETLFTLVDETQREIEVRVDSADSVAIDVGQVVLISSDAFPGLEWEESVVRLGTATDNKSNANSVKVYISLGQDAPMLRIGQQLDADIRTAWNPNTLKVPFEALISRDGQTMVAVLSKGKVKMKAVETGIEDFAMAEIKQGLSEGEMVILSKGMLLKHGDKAYPARAGE